MKFAGLGDVFSQKSARQGEEKTNSTRNRPQEMETSIKNERGSQAQASHQHSVGGLFRC
jgi:hypothetical protein